MVQTQISKALVTATSVTSYETNEIDYDFLCQGFFFFFSFYFVVSHSFMVSLEQAPQTSQCSLPHLHPAVAPLRARTVSQPRSCALPRQEGVRI